MFAVSLGSSAQLLMTGVLGEYVGRIYEEIKRRPLYIIEREINAPPPDMAQREPATAHEVGNSKRDIA